VAGLVITDQEEERPKGDGRRMPSQVCRPRLNPSSFVAGVT